jgi:hypothetical protein
VGGPAFAGADATGDLGRCARYAFAADDELKLRVEALAAAEHSCCSFLEFEIAEAGDELGLTVTAPSSGQEALRFIFA